MAEQPLFAGMDYPSSHRLILDLCSKAVVGWAADTHRGTSLVLEALTA